MKRYGNLFEQVVSLDNLYLADSKARMGKMHSKEVQDHMRNQDRNILALHDALVSGTYRTSQYSIFYVHEPKEREIAKLPYFPDRIVHHAVMNVLEPIWTRTFTHNTFSCIKRRGITGCRNYVQKVIRSFKGRPLYCLKIDIKKFYPSVKNGVLMALVRRKIKDQRLLRLLDEIICSSDGLPIGNYISQSLANLTLAYFMHWVNEELHVKATEYADDIVFYSESKEELHTVLAKVETYLRDELGLRLKENYQIFPIAKNSSDHNGRPLDYVGFKFYREQVSLRRSIKRNFCRRAAKLNRRQDISLRDYKMGIAPWLGWAKYSDSKHLLQTIIRKDYYDSIFINQARCA